MGFLDGLFGLAGAGVAAGTAKALQEDAQQFQTEFYKQRYQRQMEDMRAAGLNPILSYRTGVPGTAGGGIASAAGVGSAIAGIPGQAAAGKQARAAKSQASSAAGLRAEQIATEKGKQNLLSAQAIHSAAQARETDVKWKHGQTQLPQAEHQADFYNSKAGKAATYIQEGGTTARKVWSPFFSPVR